MSEEFYIGQIFEGDYPSEAAIWVEENNASIDELDPIENVRRFQINLTPEPTEEQRRQRIDAMTLTPSDVERALLAARGWDFDDLKAFLKTQGYTDLQIKAIGVELRANDFYRGAVLKGTNIRIVDTIGTLLGYDSDAMDYLFINKELPPQGEE